MEAGRASNAVAATRASPAGMRSWYDHRGPEGGWGPVRGKPVITATVRKAGGVRADILSSRFGRVPKWPKGTDCKSVIRGFESHLGLFHLQA